MRLWKQCSIFAIVAFASTSTVFVSASAHGGSDLEPEPLSKPVILRSDDNLAPLEKATSEYRRLSTYSVTLFPDVDYRDHFKTIGRDLKADKTTAFKWFEYAECYYATNISNDWVSLFSDKPNP
jgi:hypothetical protein